MLLHTYTKMKTNQKISWNEVTGNNLNVTECKWQTERNIIPEHLEDFHMDQLSLYKYLPDIEKKTKTQTEN
jgi:hypothetical protein